MPDKIEIKSRSRTGFIVVVIASTFALWLYLGQSHGSLANIMASYLCLGVVCYSAVQHHRRINDSSVRIEFSEFGIVIVDEGARITWNSVSQVRVGHGNIRIQDPRNVYLIITIETSHKRYMKIIDIMDCDVDARQVNEFCCLRIRQHFVSPDSL
ncbi:hypothetical protein WBG78_07470 [Chryseolinea sp. T2]|uniref:hypothetical protein n=1 Tax=Chryseolinea sp. T2 TaxID=3129255 RepID=UPI003077CE14